MPLFSPTSFCILTKRISAFALNGKGTFSISVQSHRYIDDVLSINKPKFENYLCQMYPAELDQRHHREHNLSFFPKFTTVDLEGWSTSHFHLRQTRWFQFPYHKLSFLSTSSYIPSLQAYGVFISQLIRFARDCSSYECFILRARRLSSKLLKQGYLVERLKLSFRKCYGRYGDLFQQYEVSLSWMLNGILTLDQQWLPNQFHALDTEFVLHRIMSGFPWNIWNGCGMPAGNAYPSGHLVLSPPILGLACAPIVETRFLELAMSLPDFSPRIPPGTFSSLLL